MLRIGLPQWQHPSWKRWGLFNLEDYSQSFHSVEGNTTFYALPNSRLVANWHDMTHDQFRFCFKFPSDISHKSQLKNVDKQLGIFLSLFSPLAEKIGQYWLQLPDSFSPSQINYLWKFLDQLPKTFNYGVEVRHPDFFAKGEAEILLNRGLYQRGVNRVMLDSRPVYAHPSKCPSQIKCKKPNLPTHAIRTAFNPTIRFIGSNDIEESKSLFQVWLSALTRWQGESEPVLISTVMEIVISNDASWLVFRLTIEDTWLGALTYNWLGMMWSQY